MSDSQKKPQSELYEIAELQDGYFTSKQAKAAGFIDANHRFHLKSRNWIRVWRGIYRLARYPQSDNEQYILWHLWSMNRKQEPQGVYSHETALSIYELSDVSPSKLHMTVPPNFRRSSPTPKILVLHKGILEKKDIVHMQGFVVTSPLKSILTVSEEGLTSRDHIAQAVEEAYKRGFVIRQDFEKILTSRNTKIWLKEIIKQSIK